MKKTAAKLAPRNLNNGTSTKSNVSKPPYQEERDIKWNEAEALRKKLEATLESLAQTFPLDAIIAAQQLLKLGSEILWKRIGHDVSELERILSDEAEWWFCNQTDSMVKRVCELAKSGRYSPTCSAWHSATDLAKTIHDLALTGALDELRRVARTSITMPTLRARSTLFTYDHQIVVEAIQLSDDCAINTESNAQYQLDAWPTRIVVKIIETFTNLKSIVEREEDSFNRLKISAGKPGCPDNFMRFLNLAFVEYLHQKYPNETVLHLLVCRDLPPLSESTRAEWWEKVISPGINEGTLKYLMGSTSGRRLHDQLQKSAVKKRNGSSKPGAVLAQLKKRCEQALFGKTLVRAS